LHGESALSKSGESHPGLGSEPRTTENEIGLPLAENPKSEAPNPKPDPECGRRLSAPILLTGWPELVCDQRVSSWHDEEFIPMTVFTQDIVSSIL
jgi:hypothetical protein